jgi:hypothetical protein
MAVVISANRHPMTPEAALRIGIAAGLVWGVAFGTILERNRSKRVVRMSDKGFATQ